MKSKKTIQQEMTAMFQQVAELALRDPLPFDTEAMASVLLTALQDNWEGIQDEDKVMIFSVVFLLKQQQIDTVLADIQAAKTVASLRRKT